jgi:RecA-family ATPase
MLAENIAYTVADGKSLFQRFDVERTNVVYVDSESPPHLTRARAERIARGLQAPHRGVSFIFPEKRLDLGVARNREELCRIIEKQKAGLVILDSFLCYASLRSENDNAEVREWLERLGDIPKTTGAAILLLDHAAKASPDRAKAGIPLSARGAGAKHDWADTVLTFEERKNDLKFLRTLRFPKTRFCSPVPSLILEMDSNFIFTPSGEEETCPVFLIRQTIEETPAIGASKLYETLSATVGCSTRTAMRSVADAVKLGYIRREKHGKRVTYHPKMVTNATVINNEDPEDV